MSDILSRLKALGVAKGVPEKAPKPAKEPSDRMTALQTAFPNGIVVENDCGYAFINRLKQPLSEPHGAVNMAAELLPSPLFDSIMEMQIPHKEDTLAFDTETSGLSNGTASFIFMLGLGYFDGDSYTVDQLILPDLSDEPAFLRQTELIFSRYPILLSYNGKSFDIPMLQSRLRFHMFPDFTKEIAHIDLLMQARRYWRTKLGSVRLANIEYHVLQLRRGEEEVPGYMAPDLYRNYLIDGNAGHIAGVAYHNQIDVVSLSAFMLYLNDLAARSGEDPALWIEQGVPETALIRNNLSVFSGKAISNLESFSDKEKKLMAARFLKSGDHSKGIQILRELSDAGDEEAAEKLTKLYYKLHDPENFEHYRSRCIELLQADETLGKWKKEDRIQKLQAMKIKKSRQ